MQKTLLASAAALAMLTSAAGAVDVEYYKSDETFARKIGNLYETAPAALKAKQQGAKVIVVGDTATFYKIQVNNGAPQKTAAKFSDGTYTAIAWQGDRSMARSLTFNQSVFEKEHVENQPCVVYHEMSHLWDFGPRGSRGSLSDAPSYRAAFNRDKAEYVSYVKQNPRYKEQLNGMIGYFFSLPQEAFAEVSARQLCGAGLKSEYPKYLQEIFERFMPNTIAYVKQLMDREGMLARPTVDNIMIDGSRRWPSQDWKQRSGGFFLSLPFFRIRFVMVRRYAQAPRHRHVTSTRSVRNVAPPTRNVERAAPPSTIDSGRVTVPAKS